MNVSSQATTRETRDERAHRIASAIIAEERRKLEKKTARLRAKRLAMENAPA